MSKKKQSKKPIKTIIVNLIGGPGVGKSILASDLFSAMKRKGISCEISPEYIKRKLREKAEKVVLNQIYIFAKQQFQLFATIGDVQVIITDSPFILCSIYDRNNCEIFKKLVVKEYKKYENLTYVVERDPKVPYEQEGRYQDIKGAKKVDKKVKKFLHENDIEYKTVVGIGKKSRKSIVADIKELIKNG